MRAAVISDAHANLQALEAVERALDRERVDAVWNLGDNVGYGARPNECCRLLERLTEISLIGNHDLAALGKLTLEDFSPLAASAAAWTSDQLDASSRSYLSGLEASAKTQQCGLFHGSPREPVWAYVLGPVSASEAFSLATDRIILVGHSHVSVAASLVDKKRSYREAPEGTSVDLSSGRWLLNPGSVGQPRDGDPRAAYVLLDLDSCRAEFRRVEYDIEAAQREIRSVGLPDQLASRLALGL